MRWKISKVPAGYFLGWTLRISARGKHRGCLNKDSQGVWSKEVNIEHRTHQSIGDLSRGYSWHILTSDIIWRSHYLFIAIHHFIFGSGSGWLTPGFCALCAFSSLAFPPAPQTSNAHLAAIEARCWAGNRRGHHTGTPTTPPAVSGRTHIS